MTSSTDAPAGSWGSLFRGGSGIYTFMVMLGVVLFSLQILIVVTIMPTVVADIGGAAYYVWASMLYQVGAIVGAAIIGSIWRAIGMRGGFFVTATIYTLGTLGCALAPDMLVLNLSRFVQGLGGGLVTGGTMALIGHVFLPQQRTRMLAVYQGVWTICSFLGPFFGGAFAAAGWWRGAFWASLPFAILFGIIAWLKVPNDKTDEKRERVGVPGLRLALLTLGVAGVAEAGQLANPVALAILLLISLTTMAWTFRIDASAQQPLFPTRPLSLSSPVGLGYWVLIIGGGTQAAITILLPLSLQIVHGLSPLWVGVANLIISIAWTIATFLVSGWSGTRERFALNSGVALMLVALLMLVPTAQGERLPLLFLAVFVFGWGIGSHNVHRRAHHGRGAEGPGSDYRRLAIDGALARWRPRHSRCRHRRQSRRARRADRYRDGERRDSSDLSRGNGADGARRGLHHALHPAGRTESGLAPAMPVKPLFLQN